MFTFFSFRVTQRSLIKRCKYDNPVYSYRNILLNWYYKITLKANLLFHFNLAFNLDRHKIFMICLKCK